MSDFLQLAVRVADNSARRLILALTPNSWPFEGYNRNKKKRKHPQKIVEFGRPYLLHLHQTIPVPIVRASSKILEEMSIWLRRSQSNASSFFGSRSDLVDNLLIFWLVYRMQTELPQNPLNAPFLRRF